MAQNTESRIYAAYGCTIKSDIHFSELHEIPKTARYGSKDSRIRIVSGQVPEPTASWKHMGNGIWKSEKRIIADIRGLGKMMVEDGSRITICHRIAPDSGMARVMILGGALPVIFLQKGLLPLHASAAKVKGRGIIITGPGGAGKSTTAGLLEQQGHAVLSDDMVLLENKPLADAGGEKGQQNGWIHIRQGPESLKLWGDSVSHLGVPESKMIPSGNHGRLKCFDRSPKSGKSKLVPAGGVVVLDCNPKGPKPQIQLLTGKEKLSAVFENIILPELVCENSQSSLFRISFQLASELPMWKVPVCRDWDMASRWADELAGLLSDMEKPHG